MAEHRGNRYGRSEAARVKVLNAADDLLAEMGFAAVTIEGIAKAAGVSKQTIYRWWPSKTAVLLETLVADADQRLAPPDTGTLAADVLASVAALSEFLAADDAGRVLVALRANSLLDSAFAVAYEERFAADQRAREELPIQRAIDRGELTGHLDVAVERAKLYGPVYELPVSQLTSEVARDIARQWLAGQGFTLPVG